MFYRFKSLESLALSEESAERAGILSLYCEHHSFDLWGEGLAKREVHGNIQRANRETLRRKQQEISQKLLEAHKAGKSAEEAQLNTQYQQILKLAKMAG